MLWISVFFITMTLLLFDVNIPRDPGLSTEPESVDHVGRDLGIAFALTSAFFNASPLLSLKEVWISTDSCSTQMRTTSKMRF